MTILICYTKYSKDFTRKKREKDKTTHSEKEETQAGGGVNIRPSFIARSIASFSLFFFHPPFAKFYTLNFALSSVVYFFLF